MEPILLIRPEADVPWGFRLQGGTDQQIPLTVKRITPGSIASTRLAIGDEILRIGATDTTRLTYAAAMETIKGSGDRLEIYTNKTGVPQSNESFSNYNSSVYSPNSQTNYGGTTDTNDINSFRPPPLSPQSHRPTFGESQSAAAAAAAGTKFNTQTPAKQIPDAILKMTAGTVPNKMPWTYAPDIQSLQQQRRRIQKKNLTPPATRDPVQSNSSSVQTQQDEDTEQNEGYKSIYSGAEIPSKTFQLIQSFTSSPNESGISGLARAAQRRQRRREKLQNTGTSVTDERQKTQEPEFDEAAYLAGKIPIFGSRSKNPVSTPYNTILQTPKIQGEEVSDRGDENQKPFDENAYLAGRIPLVRGGPIDPKLFDIPVSSGSSVVPEETEDKEDESKKPFDERAYLAGRIPLVKGGPIDPAQFNIPAKRVVKKFREVNRPRLKEPFDEKAYLSGKINILGQSANKPRAAARPQNAEKINPSWFKSDDEMISEDEYDEESFLSGRISIVRRSVDREIPPRAFQRAAERPIYAIGRASWQQEAGVDDGRGGTCSETEFDERAYLAGKWRPQIIADKEYSTDTEADFPSKTFRILRRSVSSERSTDEEWSSLSKRCANGVESSDDGMSSDQEKPYDCYMYHGRKIPSNTFSRLKKTMDRKAAAEHKAVPHDPIERLKEKSLENVGIDVDTAIERLEIGKHDPDSYMEMLKRSVEQNDNIRIEADNEVTDF